MQESFWDELRAPGVPSQIDVKEYDNIVQIIEGAFSEFGDKNAFTGLGHTLSTSPPTCNNIQTWCRATALPFKWLIYCSTPLSFLAHYERDWLLLIPTHSIPQGKCYTPLKTLAPKHWSL